MTSNIGKVNWANDFDVVIRGLDQELVSYRQKLEIAKHGALSTVYAPFDHINHQARIAIVGLTPGDQQARNALTAYQQARNAGKSIEIALEEAKVFASFSGPMRNNLEKMLDEIGINNHLGISSTAEVFDGASGLCHFTSLLRYPVFLNGENYSGSPLPSKTQFLWEMLQEYFFKELEALPQTLWIPLGTAVKDAFERLIAENKVSRDRALMGLPHPSGANSERINYFLGLKPRSDLSAKTNPTLIDQSKSELLKQVQKQQKNNAAVPSRPIPSKEEQMNIEVQPQLLGTNPSSILVELTGGNIRNSHFYLRSHIDFFPKDSIGGSNKSQPAKNMITVEFTGCDPIRTDLDGDKFIFRNRAASRQFFERNVLKPGDFIEISKLSEYTYRVSKR